MKNLIHLALGTLAVGALATAGVATITNDTTHSSKVSCETNGVLALMAQQEGPGGRGPGGPGQGPRRQMGGPGLLMQPDVQAELKLTDSQIEQIKALLEKNRPGGGDQGGNRGGGGKNGQGGPGHGPGGGGDPQHHEQMMAALKSILNGAQFKRFTELDLQATAPMSILRKDVAEALAITESQADQIRDIIEASRPQGGRPQDGPPQGDPDQHRRELMAKVVAVLNGDQAAKWKQMLGAEFKFKRPGPPPGRN